MKYAVGIMLSFAGVLLAMNEVKSKQVGSQIAGARVPALTLVTHSPADAARPDVEIGIARSASSGTSPDDISSSPYQIVPKKSVLPKIIEKLELQRTETE